MLKLHSPKNWNGTCIIHVAIVSSIDAVCTFSRLGDDCHSVLKTPKMNDCI